MECHAQDVEIIGMEMHNVFVLLVVVVASVQHKNYKFLTRPFFDKNYEIICVQKNNFFYVQKSTITGGAQKQKC